MKLIYEYLGISLTIHWFWGKSVNLGSIRSLIFRYMVYMYMYMYIYIHNYLYPYPYPCLCLYLYLYLYLYLISIYLYLYLYLIYLYLYVWIHFFRRKRKRGKRPGRPCRGRQMEELLAKMLICTPCTWFQIITGQPCGSALVSLARQHRHKIRGSSSSWGYPFIAGWVKGTRTYGNSHIGW